MKNYFRPNDESVIIGIPMVCMLFSLGQMIFFPHALENVERSLVRFTVNVFFLNSTHLVFPFVLLLTTKSGKEFVQRKWAKMTSWQTVLGFTFLALLYLACHLQMVSIPFSVGGTDVLALMFLWIWALFPTYHGIKQSGGILLLMKKADDKSVSLNRERRALSFYYIAVVFALASELLKIKVAGHVFSISAFGFAGYLIWASPKQILYSVRLLFWPLAFYSTLATWLLPLMHGSEYIALTRRVMSRNEGSARSVMWLSGLMISGVVAYSAVLFALNFENFNFSDLKNKPHLVLPFAFFSFFTLAHYLTDGIMYRMRDPDVKETIGKDLEGPYSVSERMSS